MIYIFKMLDKNRILSKIDELEGYLNELEKVIPDNFDLYEKSIKDKRACERILQISVETIIDICNILISNLKLGLPSEEEEIFKKLKQRGIISKELEKILLGMKGLRNILVHKYGDVDNEIVYEILTEKLNDFEKFKIEILKFLKTEK